MVKLFLRCSLIIALLTFPVSQLFTQSISDYQEGLALEIDGWDMRKMEKAVEDVIEGLQEAEEVHRMYEELSEEEKNRWRSSGHKKVLRNMGKASEDVREGHNTIYEIYRSYCEEFWETIREEGQYAAGMNKARYYERMAKKHMTSARRNRDYVLSSDNYDRAVNKFEKAMEQEKLAIRDRGRALQIYQDFPVEYDYGWEDDVDAETVARLFSDKYVVEPETEEQGRTDTVVIKQVDTVFIAQQEQEDTNPIPDSIAEQENLKWMPDVIFKVQIAAHTEPISDKEIRQIYDGTERVNVVYEDNWYKYQIGSYDDYTEARRVLNQTNVEKAFVVPYLDGKKLTIEEALKKDTDNQ